MILQNCKIFDKIDAKPSKSIFQRLLALAILSNNPTTIHNVCISDDAYASLKLIEDIGNEIIELGNNSIQIIPHSPNRDSELTCNESGLCIRMFAPILSLFSNKFIIKAEGSLKHRKIDGIESTLNTLGAKIISNNNYPPVEINGPIKSKHISLNYLESSQFLTGLLIALPFLAEKSTINVQKLVSKPYIDLTLHYIKLFGGRIEVENESIFHCHPSIYNGGEFYVENDWTNAATMMIAGAIGGQVQINNISRNSPQGDKVILDLLTEIGTKVIEKDNSILVEKNELNNFEFDATDYPDLVPGLSVLAANCKGLSRITNIDRLKNKESNRVETIINILKSSGIKVEYCDSALTIYGGETNIDLINAQNDHRIAMMAALLSINNKNDIKLIGSESVQKSYPIFWNDFNSLKK